jgi:hypothetical protein
MVPPPFRIPFTFKKSLVNDVGNMAGAAMQFAFPDHASDLAELLALAERALLAVKEKRKSSIA